jgi:hypothetical protein
VLKGYIAKYYAVCSTTDLARKLEDTKGVIRDRKSKDRQYMNDHKKRDKY